MSRQTIRDRINPKGHLDLAPVCTINSEVPTFSERVSSVSIDSRLGRVEGLP